MTKTEEKQKHLSAISKCQPSGAACAGDHRGMHSRIITPGRRNSSPPPPANLVIANPVNGFGCFAEIVARKCFLLKFFCTAQIVSRLFYRQLLLQETKSNGNRSVLLEPKKSLPPRFFFENAKKECNNCAKKMLCSNQFGNERPRARKGREKCP